MERHAKVEVIDAGRLQADASPPASTGDPLDELSVAGCSVVEAQKLWRTPAWIESDIERSSADINPHECGFLQGSPPVLFFIRVP